MAGSETPILRTQEEEPKHALDVVRKALTAFATFSDTAAFDIQITIIPYGHEERENDR
jgi:hypothetical protein